MTIEEYLQTTIAALQRAGVDSARLDAVVLLEDALQENRALLLAHLERVIPNPIAARLYKQRVLREQHQPLAYIRGKAPFYGREFTVNEHTLVPRPETETMITLLKQLHLAAGPWPDKLRIIDVGTGSGCLGITAALELPKATVTLTDIDANALRVARQNAQQLQAEVFTQEADLLPLPKSFEVVLANLPYVPETMELNRAAQHEPRHAIFSGPDGLDHYKRLWGQLAEMPARPLLVITEALASQHHTNALLARAVGYYLATHDGLAQAFQPLN